MIAPFKGKKNGEGALYASQEFAPGDPVLPIMGEPRNSKNAPSRSLQIGPDLFLGGDKGMIDNFVNHACEPNMRADIKSRHYVAIKSIKIADELTINYNATEFDMEKSGCAFDCWCQSEGCYRRVAGFNHLDTTRKQELLPLLPHWLKRMVP